MLQVAFIRENKDRVIQGLSKRKFPNPEQTIERVLSLDGQRKTLQAEHDKVLAHSNEITKTIGNLMKEGLKEEAEKKKSQTAALKAESKRLAQDLSQSQDDLRELLYQIPSMARITGIFCSRGVWAKCWSIS